MFKICLHTFGNDFGHFWNFENFLIFLRIFEDSTLHGTLGIKFFRKNHPETRLDSFGNTFGHFWNSENTFSENFRRLDIPWKTGQKIFESLPQNTSKTRLDTFGNNFGHFGKFETFLIFFENFRRLDLPWKTGQKFFEKNCPKLQSKHVWIPLGTILGVFVILKIFLIFLKIF